jgi:HAD superfamily hydrolase (TIGR01484 family)
MAVQPPEGAGRCVLATDLDGTLIPLEGNQQNRDDLQILGTQVVRRNVTLVFVTGRHLDSVLGAIDEFRLPQPGWVICDVGTSLFKRVVSGTFEPVEAYQQHQDEIITSMPIFALRDLLRPIEGLRLQEEEKQGRFKLSFYARAADLGELVARIQQVLDRADAPYSFIHSIDPFNGDGLIDLLPANVSKAHALSWWVQHTGRRLEDIVFAGDSGNDLAALTAGYRTILVGNADRELTEEVQTAHRRARWDNRLCLTRGKATSGVLEGCRKFRVV